MITIGNNYNYLYDMNLRDMEYVVAVADLGNFSRAAEQCHVSQPTLSGQIKKLEDYLGIALFERGGKHVTLTEEGMHIVTCARKIIRETRHIKEIAEHASDPLSGVYRLGTFPTLAPYFLPYTVPLIKKNAPTLRLMLVEDKSDSIIERLQHGELDAAILALPVRESSLLHEELFEDPFMLAVPSHHCLATRSTVSQDELQSHQLLLMEEGHCMRHQALDICHTSGASEDSEYRAAGLETLRQTVIAGSGITLIPAIAALPHPDIAYIPFNHPIPTRRIAIVWRKSSRRDILVQTIIRACKAAAVRIRI